LTAIEEKKLRAAERAVGFVESGMRLGLGTGSTARHVLNLLAQRMTQGELRDIAGVATSRETESTARRLGIPLISLDARQHLDLCIDGADEVDPRLDVVKGLGGALLWERIVADACDRVIIAVDDTKRVKRLGERAPIPIEVVPFGWRNHITYLEATACLATLRCDPDGRPFVTDGGHYIVDCRFPGGVPEPDALEKAVRARTGLIATGMFLGVATHVVVGHDEGVDVIERPR
jgi:ribose 5-phosphate isomerase A